MYSDGGLRFARRLAIVAILILGELCHQVRTVPPAVPMGPAAGP